MSINWENFNQDIEFIPYKVANEVRRIISNNNPNLNVNEFITLMINRMNESNQPFEKAILNFSIAAWLNKIYPNDKLEQVYVEKWEKLVDTINNFQ